MPDLAMQRAAPSTLADVIGQVIDAFGEIGDATPILVGRHYLESFGVGSPPRVLFVPEPKGRTGPPLEMGSAASVVHSCDVYVRGEESGDDLDRFRSAYELGDRVIDCIATAAPGRVEWSDYSDGSPTNADAYGAELVLSFTYARDVRHDAARWALPAADEDEADALPMVPPGQAGTVDSIEITTVPVEEN